MAQKVSSKTSKHRAAKNRRRKKRTKSKLKQTKLQKFCCAFKWKKWLTKNPAKNCDQTSDSKKQNKITKSETKPNIIRKFCCTPKSEEWLETTDVQLADLNKRMPRKWTKIIIKFLHIHETSNSFWLSYKMEKNFTRWFFTSLHCWLFRYCLTQFKIFFG